jgi:hypothetical protein
MELAIRLWARRSGHVRQTLLAMDKGRGAFLAKLLGRIGCNSDQIRPLAHLLRAVSFRLWSADDMSDTDKSKLIDVTMFVVTQSITQPASR